MSFNAEDVLRLEIEADPAPGQLVNMVQNPSGELGAYGWNTPIAGSVLDGFYDIVALRWVLRYIGSQDAGGSYFKTELMPMAAGEYVAARWHYMESGSNAYRARLTFSNASQVVISSTSYFTYNSPTDDVDANTGPFLAPAGTAFVHLAFEVGDPGGVYPIAIQQAHLRITDVTVCKAATSAELVTTRTNLMTNPSFQTNSTGWSLVAPGTWTGTLTRQTSGGVQGAACLRLTVDDPSSGSAWAATDIVIPVTAGRTYTLSGYLYKSTSVSTTEQNLRVYTPGNVTLGTLDMASSPNSTWTRLADTFTVPAGVTSVNLSVRYIGDMAVGSYMQWDGLLLEESDEMGSYFDGSTVAAGGWTYSWNGTAHGSTSKATTLALEFVEPTPYNNILGDLREIATSREELNVGTLTAVVTNPALSPAEADTIRPGRRYRLMAADPTDPGSYAPLIVGKLGNAKVEYRPLNTDPDRLALITLTGVDNVSLLANAKRSSTVGRIVDLPYVLEGAGVPWRCDGQSDQVASAEVVVVNDNASALDQVAITRDTAGGYAWVDRQGVLRVNSVLPGVEVSQIANGSFTSGTTGWATFGATLSTTTLSPVSADGGACMSIAPVGSTTDVYLLQGNPVFGGVSLRVFGGQEIEATAYVRSNVSRNSTLYFGFWAEDESNVGWVYNTVGEATATPVGSWQTRTRSFTVPPGAYYMSVQYAVVHPTSGTNLPSTDRHYIDGVSLTVSEPLVKDLDDTVYNPNLVVDYDTDRCINSVAIHRQWTHSTEGPQETVYGPYTDAASIAEWGLHHSTITVAGTDPADIPAFASAVLAKNATPEVRVQSLQVWITDETLAYAFIDLYELLHVVNAPLGIDTHMRATAIKHEIVANPDRAQGDRWLMTMEFSSEGGVATPTQAPPLGSQTATGVPMLVMSKNSSPQTLTASTWTVVSGWDVVTNTGFTSVAGSEVTIATAGVYFVSFTVGYNSNTSRCLTSITLNSTNGGVGQLAREDNASSAARIGHNVAGIVRCVAGDVIRGLAWSDVARNVEQNLSAMNVYRIGD